MKILLLAALLAAHGVRAQVAAPAGPPAGYGVTVEGRDWVYHDDEDLGSSRLLSADERSRLQSFFSSLPADGRDAALAAPLLAGLARAGRAPATTDWFEGDASAPRLTAHGRGALTAALLSAAPQPESQPRTSARTAAGPEESEAQKARLEALRGRIADGANLSNFDGAAARANDAAVADAVASPLPPSLRPSKEILASLPDAPSAMPAQNAVSRRESIENAAFKSTLWGYHAAWAADFATTAMVLKRGGYETDPLYTRFGNKNMAGVIGSAVAVHVGVTIASVYLHEEAKKHEGFEHYALEAAAILINGYGIGVHSKCALQNADLLQHWNGR